MMPRPLTCSFDLIQFPINLWSELARFKLRVNKISHIKMQSARHTLKYRIIYFKWFFIQSIVKHEAAKWNEYKMRIQVLLKCAVLSFSILASVIQMIRWIVCLRCVQQNRMVCENALISGLEDWLQFFWVFVSALKMTMLSTKSHEFTWYREKDVSKKKNDFFCQWNRVRRVKWARDQCLFVRPFVRPCKHYYGRVGHKNKLLLFCSRQVIVVCLLWHKQNTIEWNTEIQNKCKNQSQWFTNQRKTHFSQQHYLW